MRTFQLIAGDDLQHALDTQTQKTVNSTSETDKPSWTAMLEFLCSSQRTGRFRQCSLEMDVEYLRWFLDIKVSGTP